MERRILFVVEWAGMRELASFLLLLGAPPMLVCRGAHVAMHQCVETGPPVRG